MSPKTVLITGGTGALGQTVVEAALKEGHSVAVVYRSRDEWNQLSTTTGEEERLLGLEGDVTSPESMDQLIAEMLKKFDSLDGLFHLVGGYAYASLEETSTDLWQRILALNLTSAYVVARAALPALTASRGMMAFVGAQAALSTPANQAAYNSSKAAVLAFVRTLANELRDKGIRVNSVVPDIIDTPANRQSMPKANYDRWLSPQQVADVLLYLLSDQASAVTGATISLQRS